MKSPTVVLSISTEMPTHSKAFASGVLEGFSNSASSLWPERIGFDDTGLRTSTRECSAEDIAKCWAPDVATAADRIPSAPIDSLLWKRSSKPKCSGQFSHTWRNSKGSILPGGAYLSLEGRSDINFLDLFERWCYLYEPKFGFLHAFTKLEIEYYDPDPNQRAAWGDFRLGVFGTRWNQTLQNFGAYNFFSTKMIEDVSLDELKNVSVGIRECRGGIIVSLVESLESLQQDFTDFSNRRAALKSAMPANSCVIQAEPTS